MSDQSSVTPAPAASPPAPPTTPNPIGHLSSTANDVLHDVIDRLTRGETVIITSVEDLSGQAGHAFTTTMTKPVKTPLWKVLVGVGFTVFGVGVGLFLVWRLFQQIL